MKSICTECDLAKCDVANKKRCTKSKQNVFECKDFVHHKCRSCANISNCAYAYNVPYVFAKDFKFITKVLPTSKEIIVVECKNYKFIENKPRGKTRKVSKLCSDFLDEIYESQRK